MIKGDGYHCRELRLDAGGDANDVKASVLGISHTCAQKAEITIPTFPLLLGKDGSRGNNFIFLAKHLLCLFNSSFCL